MSTSTDWTCPCRVVNSGAAVWCEACGTERPDRAGRALSGKPKVQETHAPYVAPTYPAPQPGDDALIRAEIARARKLLGMAEGASQADADTESAPSRLGLAIDPAIRAEVARRDASAPEPVGAVVGRVLQGRRP